jgi:L-lactate utilization protein LutB
MDLNKTIKNLQKNRITPYVVDSKEGVLTLLRQLIPIGSTVTHGGSVTLSECGIPDMLRNGDYRYLDRTAVADPMEVYQKGYGADIFLSSSNAITEDGELYNVDGNSNRISALCFGPKKVIIIAGINKIVPTLDDAIVRVKSIAAPQNARRLNCNTYCAKEGKCISLVKGSRRMTDGCGSDTRICRNYLISGAQRDPERVTVIIVKENLGY